MKEEEVTGYQINFHTIFLQIFTYSSLINSYCVSIGHWDWGERFGLTISTCTCTRITTSLQSVLYNVVQKIPNNIHCCLLNFLVYKQHLHKPQNVVDKTSKIHTSHSKKNMWYVNCNLISQHFPSATNTALPPPCKESRLKMKPLTHKRKVSVTCYTAVKKPTV